MPGSRFYWTLATILSTAATLQAAAPTTRPVVKAPTTPAEPRERAAIIDPTKPAFIPKFARINNPPAGNFAERQYASQYMLPAPIYGGGYYGGYGYGVCSGGYSVGVEWSGGTGCP